jgi:cyclophilin family peptidyl-prolyl cis-trans isomerase
MRRLVALSLLASVVVVLACLLVFDVDHQHRNLHRVVGNHERRRKDERHRRTTSESLFRAPSVSSGAGHAGQVLRFETSSGVIEVELLDGVAPSLCAYVAQLIRLGHYSGDVAAFYRLEAKFIVQLGRSMPLVDERHADARRSYEAIAERSFAGALDRVQHGQLGESDARAPNEPYSVGMVVPSSILPSGNAPPPPTEIYVNLVDNSNALRDRDDHIVFGRVSAASWPLVSLIAHRPTVAALSRTDNTVLSALTEPVVIHRALIRRERAPPTEVGIAIDGGYNPAVAQE